jgi:general secretion pathway protein E
VRDLANQPPVVRFVSLLIREAYDAGASDIHLESARNGLTTRFRIDGVLQPAIDPPPSMDRAIISRVKLLAELDIAERRRPQDGRIRVRLHERELDLRVSTVPTAFGESVVLRLLERGSGAIGLETLGLSPALLETMQRLAQQPHGMILVTGPTGSGKTTTLYSALGLRSAAAEKIITLEDPIEYTLDGVAQVPVHAETGVTFASMLRSILRQDPDVVLVGEMRDNETAELAVQAALTGHVVFSTLHTNDAVGAIPRLLDLGVAPYLISATLEAVLAQRLVRKICLACRAQGCPDCRGTGYSGRTGLFELLVMTDDIREALVTHPSRRRLEELATQAGLRPLKADGGDKITAGITTTDEVLRVTLQ